MAAAATLSAPLVAAADRNLVIVEHNVAPASPNWLTTGPDGNLWFTDSNHNSVDRVTLDGTVTAYPVVGSNVLPSEITSGPDGSLWFLEMNGQGTPPVTYVGRMTTSGVATEYPTSGGFFAGIAAGPDGDVWFNEADTFSVAKISPDGHVTEYPNPNGPSAELAGITAANGNMWVTDASEGIVWRVTTAGVFTAFNLPPGRQPAAITTGADGNLWFYENNANDIGRMTTAGSLTEYAIPTANASIAGLTTGADGNVWFTEVQPNQVGVTSPAGVIHEYPIPTANSLPRGPVLGPDHHIWFPESNAANLARIAGYQRSDDMIPPPAGQLAHPVLRPSPPPPTRPITAPAKAPLVRSRALARQSAPPVPSLLSPTRLDAILEQLEAFFGR